jgi:hypothetical protein
MNPTLAALYGLTKTASEEEVIDLHQISGADLIEGLENGTIELEGDEIEKEAGDDLDLSDLTGADLLEILEQLEDDDEPLNKTASTAELEMAGRIMAHAYADELTKFASDEDEVYDLSEISAEDTIAMLESGEYEIVEGEIEKEAGAREMGKAYLARLTGKKTREILRGAQHGKGGFNAKGKGSMPDKKQAVKDYFKMLRGGPKSPDGKRYLAGRASDVRKDLGVQAATGATGVAGAGGVAALIRRKKGRK